MNWQGFFAFFGILTLKARCNVIGRNNASRTRDVMHELQSVTSLEGFLRLVQINGRPMRLEDVYPEYQNGDREYISGGFTLGLSDECSARLTTVEIPRDPNDASVVYYPKCTRVMRCGGCCTTERVQCKPKPNTATVTEFHVLKARLPFPGALNLDWEGPMPVVMESHTFCEAACILGPEDCREGQIFDDIDCSCKCTNPIACPPYKRYDQDTCSCQCQEVRYCGRSNFNRETCLCEIIGNNVERQYVGIEERITDAERREYERRLNASRNTTTATSPLTRTTPAAPGGNGCPPTPCPPRFTMGPTCECTTLFSFPGR